jgi:SnoaL-like domain
MTGPTPAHEAVPSKADEVVAAWRTAAEHGDADAATRCLAADIEVISPLTAQFRFQGRDQVQQMLAAAFEVITEFRFHTEVGAGSTWALFGYAQVSQQEFEEAQLLRLDAAGLIRELTLFGRPLPALTGLMAGIGPKLSRRQGRAGLARVIGAATAPLAAMTRLGDRRLMPLADPSRPSKQG